MGLIAVLLCGCLFLLSIWGNLPLCEPLPLTGKLKRPFTVTDPRQQGSEMLLPWSSDLESNAKMQVQLRTVPAEAVE